MKQLKNSNYKPRPSKKIRISKNKQVMNSLVIASTKDKLVRTALKIILEPIFEPIFSTCSHGFRFNKSCHTALRQIDMY